jgi:hypothetical protein
MASTSATATATFTSTYAQFLDDLRGTFPEYAAVLVPREDAQARFVELWGAHTSAVAARDTTLFVAPAGIEVVPGLTMTAALWSELSGTTQSAIWKYISTLLLLAAAESGKDGGGDASGLWDISGFEHDIEELMSQLKEGAAGGEGGSFASMFEQIRKLTESMGFKEAAADASGAGAAPASDFKIPERLFKGHIAKIVEELVKEFKPEDFGISPEMMDVKDPAKVFEYLQEIFTKKPETLMAAGKKIAKKLQAKFASGAIKRDEIIREVEELMKEFSSNTAFSELFGSLGDMLKSTEKESGSEGSARRREVQERLRRKQAEKEARRTAAAAITVPLVAAGGAGARAADVDAAAYAAMAELLADEAMSKKAAGGTGGPAAAAATKRK